MRDRFAADTRRRGTPCPRSSAGYSRSPSGCNLAALEEREIDGYIAPGRAKHASAGEGGSARIAAMREKIKAGGHASPYRLRKQLPEPVFGQIKQARGFRQFLLRGVEKVASEWGFVCVASPKGGLCPKSASQPDEPGKPTNAPYRAPQYSASMFQMPIASGLSRQAPRRKLWRGAPDAAPTSSRPAQRNRTAETSSSTRSPSQSRLRHRSPRRGR